MVVEAGEEGVLVSDIRDTLRLPGKDVTASVKKLVEAYNVYTTRRSIGRRTVVCVHLATDQGDQADADPHEAGALPPPQQPFLDWSIWRGCSLFVDEVSCTLRPSPDKVTRPTRVSDKFRQRLRCAMLCAHA